MYVKSLVLEILQSMTSLLQNKTKEDYGSEYNLVKQGGENLVLSLGNLLKSAAQKANVSRKIESAEKRTEVRIISVNRNWNNLLDNESGRK